MKSLIFEYIDRGNKDLLVLIPGWATDYRIFDSLNLKFNYLLPIDFLPVSFEKSLLETLKKKNITKISLFGWSLGGFVAYEFASKYPNLIDGLILVSIRKQYKTEELVEIKKLLKKNKKGYLYKFFNQCFYNKEEMGWFKKNLLKGYCKNLDLDYLLKVLDYLENAKIKPELINNIKKIKIIHGRYDSIAPIREAMDIKSNLPYAKFILIENAGHIPFLKENFNKYI